MKTVSLCADIIKLPIAETEAGVTDHTSTPFANKESAETETVMKDIQRPANILWNTPPVFTKISVPMHTLLTEVMKSKIYWGKKVQLIKEEVKQLCKANVCINDKLNNIEIRKRKRLKPLKKV